jgi:hypothetical protein
MADLEYSVADGIGTIRLNRPERKNAFTLDMVDHWAAVLGDARTDPEVRVLILTGTGDAFCSGVDLERRNEGRAATPLARKQVLSDQVHRIALAMEDLDKPVIAAINRTAVGAGLDMALMCDMCIMARSARASEGYIRVGLVPGDGGCCPGCTRIHLDGVRVYVGDKPVCLSHVTLACYVLGQSAPPAKETGPARHATQALGVPRITATGQWQWVTQCSLTEPRSMPTNSPWP